MPFYSKDPQTVVKLVASDITCWIFDDGASYTSAAGGGSLECEDFNAEADLIDELLRQLRSVIGNAA